MSRAEPTSSFAGASKATNWNGRATRERVHAARVSLGTLFRAESADYFWLLGLTVFMVAFGLLMVLSSSYVTSYSDGSSFLSKFFSQASYAFVGVPLMLIVSRVPVRLWQRLSPWLLAISCALQALTVFTPLGTQINQNTNWLKLGPITFQPSELIKFALVLWVATFVTRKERRLNSFAYTTLPLLIVACCAIGLVIKGGDLGTTMIMLLTVVGALFVAGTPLVQLGGAGVFFGGVAVLFAVSRSSRLERITAFLHPSAADPLGTGWQIMQAKWGMANGGFWGVGLGNSEAKWNWLPASSTDFIFAIIAEELGLIGAVMVLALFVGLAIVLVRIIRSAPSVFARVVTGAVMAWIMGQAIVNVAVVVGLFPVLGVPLPLISSGGTALISTLAALGIVLSFARVQGTAAR